jgi:hypothetical protein
MFTSFCLRKPFVGKAESPRLHSGRANACLSALLFSLSDRFRCGGALVRLID